LAFWISLHLGSLKMVGYLWETQHKVLSNIFATILAELVMKMDSVKDEIQRKQTLIPQEVLLDLKSRLRLLDAHLEQLYRFIDLEHRFASPSDKRALAREYVHQQKRDFLPHALESKASVSFIRGLLYLRCSRHASTQILKLALSEGEEAIASILVSYYEVSLTGDLINWAIAAGSFKFL